VGFGVVKGELGLKLPAGVGKDVLEVPCFVVATADQWSGETDL
jgi:hypothetical protein